VERHSWSGRFLHDMDRPRLMVGLAGPLIAVSLFAPWATWTNCQCEDAGTTTYLNVFRSFRQFQTYFNPHVLHQNPAPIVLAVVAIVAAVVARLAVLVPALLARARSALLILAVVLECIALAVMIGAPYLDGRPAGDEASKNLFGFILMTVGVAFLALGAMRTPRVSSGRLAENVPVLNS